MSLGAETAFLPAGNGASRRWILAAAVVALVHLSLGLWLRPKLEAPAAAGASPDALMIELAPLAVSPSEAPAAETAPPQPMTPAEPEKAAPAPELAPAPKPDAVLPSPPKRAPRPSDRIAKPPPKPVIKRAPLALPTAATRTQSAPGSDRPAAQAASGAPSLSAGNWRGQVSAQLNRNKPSLGPEDGQGSVTVFFTIDRRGRVLSSRVTQSSGSAPLDQKALEIIQRSNPFPAPPPEVAGATIALPLTIRFGRR